MIASIAKRIQHVDSSIARMQTTAHREPWHESLYADLITERDALLSAKTGQVFMVAKTYDVTTPESASNGSVAESGFVYVSTPMTLREVLSELDSLGYYENLQDTDCSQSLYCTDPTVDYSDASETREALHIDGSPRAMRKLYRILKGRQS